MKTDRAWVWLGSGRRLACSIRSSSRPNDTTAQSGCGQDTKANVRESARNETAATREKPCRVAPG